MIKRELYMKRIRPFMESDLVKVLTGIRRSGKSVMLRLIQEELRQKGIQDSQFIYFNFESFENAEFCTAKSLYSELKNRIRELEGKAYLFFDEIQEVAEWEKCINSARVDFDCDIYITGSNAKLLSGELATYLGGRYVEFVIYPFSFEEFLESRKQKNGEINTAAEFQNYLKLGGMPFLTNLNDDDSCVQYLRDVFNSVVLKDIVSRNGIRDTDMLDRIISYLMENIGHTFSATGISNYFKSENRKVAPNTILNYIKACTDAYLFVKAPREDLIGKKLLTVNEKYYVSDHGFRESKCGRGTKDIDQLLENVVGMELIRRGYRTAIGKVNNREIDFLAERNGKKIYVQVAYLLSSEETIQREFGIYEEVRDNFPKYVVSMDEPDLSRNGIIHKNIREFLLMEEWN